MWVRTTPPSNSISKASPNPSVAVREDGLFLYIDGDKCLYASPFPPSVAADSRNWMGETIKGPSSWVKQAGVSNIIRVAAAGKYIVVIDTNNKIWYSNTTTANNGQYSFTQLGSAADTFTAKEIAIAAGGQIICIGTDNNIYFSYGITQRTGFGIIFEANWIKASGLGTAKTVAISAPNPTLPPIPEIQQLRTDLAKYFNTSIIAAMQMLTDLSDSCIFQKIKESTGDQLDTIYNYVTSEIGKISTDTKTANSAELNGLLIKIIKGATLFKFANYFSETTILNLPSIDFAANTINTISAQNILNKAQSSDFLTINRDVLSKTRSRLNSINTTNDMVALLNINVNAAKIEFYKSELNFYETAISRYKMLSDLATYFGATLNSGSPSLANITESQITAKINFAGITTVQTYVNSKIGSLTSNETTDFKARIVAPTSPSTTGGTTTAATNITELRNRMATYFEATLNRRNPSLANIPTAKITAKITANSLAVVNSYVTSQIGNLTSNEIADFKARIVAPTSPSTTGGTTTRPSTTGNRTTPDRTTSSTPRTQSAAQRGRSSAGGSSRTIR